MAQSRPEQSDPRVIQDWTNEGRGKGRNGSYKPWLRIQNLANLGRRERLKDHFSGGRTFHLLRALESKAFPIFE